MSHREHPPVVVMIEDVGGVDLQSSPHKALRKDQLRLHERRHLRVAHFLPGRKLEVEMVAKLRLSERQTVAIGDFAPRCRDRKVERAVAGPGVPGGLDRLRDRRDVVVGHRTQAAAGRLHPPGGQQAQEQAGSSGITRRAEGEHIADKSRQ